MTHRVKEERPKHISEFPKDFDNNYYHNEAIVSSKKIDTLRYLVYKQIKDAISNKLKDQQSGELSLQDSFTVTIEANGYSKFVWAVIREELMERDFVAEFKFVDEKIQSLDVVVERKIQLTGTLQVRYESSDDENENEEEKE